MTKLAAFTAGVLAVLVSLAIVIAAAFGANTNQPSDTAVAEIPPHLLRAYMDAAGTCPGLPWEVLAAIGWTESRHARRPEANKMRPAVRPIAASVRPKSSSAASALLIEVSVATAANVKRPFPCDPRA